MRIRTRQKNTISGAWLVRVLARRGGVATCKLCSSRMFVPAGDGICPVCRSVDHRRETAISQIVEEQLGSVGDWT